MKRPYWFFTIALLALAAANFAFGGSGLSSYPVSVLNFVAGSFCVYVWVYHYWMKRDTWRRVS